MQEPTTFRGRDYIQRNLFHHWRIHVAVALGVMVATAVLSGALLVGDSVRSSLQRLTLERLGRIDSLIIGDHFFSEQRVEEARQGVLKTPDFAQAVGIILMPRATLERPSPLPSDRRRAHQVTVVGCDSKFWELAADNQADPRPPALHGRQIMLNAPLANDLQVQVGDTVVVRVPAERRLAGDSTMAHRDDQIESIAELEVAAIVPANGLARFSLQATQASPRTAFLPLATLQAALDEAGRFNAICIAGPHSDRAAGDEAVSQLHSHVHWTLADAGLRIKHVELGYADNSQQLARQTVWSYWTLTTDSLLFPPEAERRLDENLKDVPHQAVLTYLANSIARDGTDTLSATAIPYSTVAAIAPGSELSPLWDEQTSTSIDLKDEEIALNAWAVDDLGVKPGDAIRLTYFTPEATHGEPEERSAVFTLKYVVPLAKPSAPYRRDQPAKFTSPPTRANDPDLTPEVPGITDQDSMDSWDAPFPFDYRRIRKPKDEDYWNNYRTTPKAFVSKSAGEKLWGSRFGQTSSFRISDRAIANADDLRRRVERAISQDPDAFGFHVVRVKRDGLVSSQGTTPFQFLFLGFSFFLIASALMLVGLLFRLGLEQRAAEVGLLRAVGISSRRVLRWFLGEAAIVAAGGALLGSLLGIAYAALMIMGLRTWWLEAVVTPFLQLHIGRLSLPLGIAIGLITALLTITASLWGFRYLTIRRLLDESLSDELRRPTARSSRISTFVRLSLAVLAVACILGAVGLRGEAQAGAFFAGGACMLAAIIGQVAHRLRHPGAWRSVERTGFGLPQLVWRNMGRNASRSILTLALMASACFMIVAISAFRLSPTAEGTGGFALLAVSDQPIYVDFADPAARGDAIGNEAAALDRVTIYAARLVDGDDASCRNLYQAQRPRIVGLPDRLLEQMVQRDRPGFQFAASAARTPEERENPWRLLRSEQAGILPVILDKNTAMYGLHLYGGIGQEFSLDYGRSGVRRFRVVGLLSNSVLQGSLFVAEEELVRSFPQVSGYRYFFIDADAPLIDRTRAVLENAFGDQGFQTVDTRALLTDLLAVQNTYLSTFQSLGGLGLLLGTIGLMAVQWRSVLERRKEFAILQATGFPRRRIAWLVFLEHLALLLTGLAIGVGAALLVVLPQAWTTDIRPPWTTLGWILPSMVALGLVTGLTSLRPLLRSPLLASLRGK